MERRRFGESVPKIATKEIIGDGQSVPGLGWEVSEETRREIEKIEENIRTAEKTSGMLLMG